MLRWPRIFGSILTFVGAGATVASAQRAAIGPLPVPDEMHGVVHAVAMDDVTPRADTCVPADQCCKICSKGKACGNTSIRRSYDCHKGRGCACNAEEVCE